MKITPVLCLAALALLPLGCDNDPAAPEEAPEQKATSPETAPEQKATSPETAPATPEEEALNSPDEEDEQAGEAVPRQSDEDERAYLTELEAVVLDDLPVPQELPPSPHPIFDLWEKVLTSHASPVLFLCGEPERPLTDEEQEELEEVREHILVALKAAREFYSARWAIIDEAFNNPDFYLEEGQDTAPRQACSEWLADGFRRDLEALANCALWLKSANIPPALSPGRQELLFRPELETLDFEQMRGGTAEIVFGCDRVNDVWKKRQSDFMLRFFSLYNSEDLSDRDYASLCDPLTGMHWQKDSEGKMNPGNVQFRARMKQHLLREAQAWAVYRTAMRELVCPCRGYRGSGEGIICATLESHLLDSRERFIHLLNAGILRAHLLPRLEVLQQAELLPLHTEYPYGEIFTERASLFRHPELEGQPWCIRFRGQGAGFIFVPETKALQAYVAEHPQGGKVWVMGHQSIESVGSPYKRKTLLNTKTYSRFQTAPPADAMKLRQVFRMLRCLPEEQAPPYVEYEGKFNPDEEDDE